MKLRFVDEPLLEFGESQHICPRAGITKYDVYDTKIGMRRSDVILGTIGTGANLSMLDDWLSLCREPILAKESNQPNLFAEFCGFNESIGFKAIFRNDSYVSRTLSNGEIKGVLKIKDRNKRVQEAVSLYSENVRFLAQNRNVDVIICVLPEKLYENIAFLEPRTLEAAIEEETIDDIETNFRRLLKAKSMMDGIPIQIVREASLKQKSKGQQDAATKAWNFCTALYYKANQTVPWKLVSNISKPPTCYVGISFYRSRDRKTLNTSLAQIFDELGNSVILRGTPVSLDKSDRIPHLTNTQASELLERALEQYEVAMSTKPARVVLHKSSNYYEDELDGFRQAADGAKVNYADFVTIRDSNLRLLRGKQYPPYRGMHATLTESNHLLYTRGFVPYYGTYPGSYIPEPLDVTIVEADESAETICDEILGLSKMNWNNTQFDGKYPITIECSRRVGKIMKYLEPHENPKINYSFYM